MVNTLGAHVSVQAIIDLVAASEPNGSPVGIGLAVASRAAKRGEATPATTVAEPHAAAM